MTEWKTYTLKELSKGRGEYGIGAPAVPFDKEKYTYLRITDINDDGTLNTSGMMSVDADDAEEYILICFICGFNNKIKTLLIIT